MQSRIDNLFEQTFPCRGAQYNAILSILHLSCTRVNTHTHICTYSKLSRKTLSATTSVLCLCLKFSTHTQLYAFIYACMCATIEFHSLVKIFALLPLSFLLLCVYERLFAHCCSVAIVLLERRVVSAHASGGNIRTLNFQLRSFFRFN